MVFTVTRPNGVSDAEFPDYARVVRQSGKGGVDLGRLPRVLDPNRNGRWLYCFETKEKAQALAKELKERTPVDSWEVVGVNSTISERPLGPVVIQMARRSDGLYFSLHTLSRAMLKSAFPDKIGLQGSVFIERLSGNRGSL